MLAGGYSWRLYFYVETALAGALFVLAFFFVEETAYKRVLPALTPVPNSPTSPTDDEKTNTPHHLEAAETLIPERKSYASTLKPWSSIDHDADFFMTMVRPFTYFTVPAVFWVISTYGEHYSHNSVAVNIC
jgi:hypothetical protein